MIGETDSGIGSHCPVRSATDTVGDESRKEIEGGRVNQSNQHLNHATMVRGAFRFRASLTACVIAGGIVVLVALPANSRARPVEAPGVDSAMPRR